MFVMKRIDIRLYCMDGIKVGDLEEPGGDDGEVTGEWGGMTRLSSVGGVESRCSDYMASTFPITIVSDSE